MEALRKIVGLALLAGVVVAWGAAPAKAQDRGRKTPAGDERRVADLLVDSLERLADGRHDDAATPARTALELDPANDEAKLLLYIAQHFTAEPPWMAALKKKLEAKISFDFVQTPLRDIVTFLQAITEATIILDENAAADLANPNVTLKVTDMKLDQALGWIVDTVGLKYCLTSRAVFITSEEQAKPEVTRYNVADVDLELRDLRSNLKTSFSGYGFHPRHPEGFIFFLGTIFCRDAEGRILEASIVRPGERVLLDRDRLTREQYGTILAGQGPSWVTDVSKSFDRKVSFDFVETPLRDIVTFLQAITKATIILDENAVADLANPNVTLKVTDMRLGQALGWIVSLVDLTYCFKDGAVFISTEKIAPQDGPTLYYAPNMTFQIQDGPDNRKTFSGGFWHYGPTGTFRAICKDAEGRHLELQGWQKLRRLKQEGPGPD